MKVFGRNIEIEDYATSGATAEDQRIRALWVPRIPVLQKLPFDDLRTRHGVAGHFGPSDKREAEASLVRFCRATCVGLRSTSASPTKRALQQ